MSDVKERLKRLAEELKKKTETEKAAKSVRVERPSVRMGGVSKRVLAGDSIRRRLLKARLRRKLAERLEMRKKENIGSRIAELREKRKERLVKKIAELRRKISRIKRRGGVADTPMQYAQNLESSRTKNYAVPVKKPAIATREDLERLKAKQEEKVPPVWRGVDLRNQLRVAWIKALNGGKNEIKAELYDSLVGLGVKDKVAVMVIEKAFKKGSKGMVKDFIKIAEDVMEMPEEQLKEEERAIELSITLQPDGSVEGEYEEEVVSEESVEEEGDEELEQRLVESSVRLPKIATEERDSLLKKALPQYGILK
jgi:hypothetical protein